MSCLHCKCRSRDVFRVCCARFGDELVIADAQLFSTLERKRAHVLGADDGTFLVELRAFLRWALGDPRLREHMVSLLEPTEEVLRYIEAVPSLIADARNVAHWLRAEAPAACAEIGNDAHWAEFDRLVDLIDTPTRRSLRELTEITEAVFTTLRAVREAVGRSAMGKNDDERVAAWRTAVELANTYDHRMRERDFAAEASPGVALSRIVALCRAASTPPEGVAHWTDFAPADSAGRFSVRSLQSGLRDSQAEWVAFARGAFRRFMEGLITSLEEGLSLRYVASRFEERANAFDRDRLRRMATVDGEDALTNELARYLHDRGLAVSTGASGAVAARAVVV